MYRVMYTVKELEDGIYGQGSTLEIAEERARAMLYDVFHSRNYRGRVVLRWVEARWVVIQDRDLPV